MVTLRAVSVASAVVARVAVTVAARKSWQRAEPAQTNAREL